jgi:hypothetical protein
MLVPLDATHYARLIEGYLCVNEHGAAHALLSHADWLKSTDSRSIDNATRRLLATMRWPRVPGAISDQTHVKSGLFWKQPVVFLFDHRITFTAALLQPDPVEH